MATVNVTVTVRIIEVDDDFFVVLPPEVLKLADIKEGDKVEVKDTEEGILIRKTKQSELD
jgi:AbrB family looped-hinge helix DNA binding protein